THFTVKSFLKIPHYNVYDTKHPSGRGHGGSAIIIKQDIKHFFLCSFADVHIQATAVTIITNCDNITLSAIYSPPKHKITVQQYESFFKLLGNKFIAGGDYNAKHKLWGSKTTTPRGKVSERTIRKLSLDTISTGEPTYWPSAQEKTPDLLDFAITKGLHKRHFVARSCLDLTSDHSPILIDFSSKQMFTYGTNHLYNNSTLNWTQFKDHLEIKINCNIPLKTPEQIETAVMNFTGIIQEACWIAIKQTGNDRKYLSFPDYILQKIKMKRKLKNIWQKRKTQLNKSRLNASTKEVKQLIQNYLNTEFHNYITKLSPNEDTNYSLWKATKRLKRSAILLPAIKKNDSSWARSRLDRANVFAEHLQHTFKPNTGSCNITPQVTPQPTTEYQVQIISPTTFYYYLTGRNSKLSTSNKLLIYKTIIKPIWMYGIALWGTSAKSHIAKMEALQSIILRIIVNAP
ncbi:PREDICTED: RNA-directed DNA polymerase from mobile element jockey-like, partial [Dufourea novaeangliae]|uniref:RNA-directed DNA polymerase from mobile element jockey-like n=1 Tax=Dufourea novaeangliae TaxID=178035 RepID=UPI0007673629